MNASITSIGPQILFRRYNRVLTVLGTRPEAIKFAPVIRALEHAGIEHAVCSTGQHREMLAQVFNAFDLSPTFDLQLMTAGQQLGEIAGAAVSALTKVIGEYKPDLVLVQGDTTTAFAGAAAAFYSRVAVGHIEAGLRTGDLQSPFPEEANRKLIGVVADWHFAPTVRAQQNLLREGCDPRRILITGNTGIDALRLMRERLDADAELRGACERKFGFIDPAKKLVLVTGHRRENFGEGLAQVFNGFKRLAQRPDVQIVYPVHLNPNVKGPAHEILGGVDGVHLVPPVEYHEMVYLMERASLIITDSGGIQEEAPTFGVPLLVTRDVTERQEAVEAGCAKLIGTDPRKMMPEAIRVLEQTAQREPGHSHHNPFGDGYAAMRICAALMGVPDAIAGLSTSHSVQQAV
jgi:UDP-N-acetylglucosamine 2-epimerase